MQEITFSSSIVSKPRPLLKLEAQIEFIDSQLIESANCDAVDDNFSKFAWKTLNVYSHYRQMQIMHVLKATYSLSCWCHVVCKPSSMRVFLCQFPIIVKVGDIDCFCGLFISKKLVILSNFNESRYRYFVALQQ